MSSNATTNETSNVASLPSSPKAQTAKEVIAANVKPRIPAHWRKWRAIRTGYLAS